MKNWSEQQHLQYLKRITSNEFIEKYDKISEYFKTQFKISQVNFNQWLTIEFSRSIKLYENDREKFETKERPIIEDAYYNIQNNDFIKHYFELTKKLSFLRRLHIGEKNEPLKYEDIFLNPENAAIVDQILTAKKFIKNGKWIYGVDKNSCAKVYFLLSDPQFEINAINTTKGTQQERLTTMYNYFGIPIFTSLEGELKNLIVNNKIGMFYDNVNSLENCILYLKEKQSLQKSMSENAKKLYNDNFPRNSFIVIVTIHLNV